MRFRALCVSSYSYSCCCAASSNCCACLYSHQVNLLQWLLKQAVSIFRAYLTPVLFLFFLSLISLLSMFLSKMHFIKTVSLFRFNQTKDIMLCAYKHQNSWRTSGARYRRQLGCKHPERVSHFTSVSFRLFYAFLFIGDNCLLTSSQKRSFVWWLSDQRRLGFDRPTVFHLLVMLPLHRILFLITSDFFSSVTYLSNIILFASSV